MKLIDLKIYLVSTAFNQLNRGIRGKITAFIVDSLFISENNEGITVSKIDIGCLTILE